VTTSVWHPGSFSIFIDSLNRGYHELSSVMLHTMRSSRRPELLESVEAISPYALLSYTWDEGEVTFEEIRNLSQSELRTRRRYEKTIWILPGCINKSCSDELTEATNSMFRWHRNAATCYVYLLDVQLDTIADGSSVYSAFAQSRWFTRGWTLQELLATRHVTFYDKRWSWLDTNKTYSKE
jgi:hypothetical protein